MNENKNEYSSIDIEKTIDENTSLFYYALTAKDSETFFQIARKWEAKKNAAQMGETTGVVEQEIPMTAPETPKNKIAPQKEHPQTPEKPQKQRKPPKHAAEKPEKTGKDKKAKKDSEGKRRRNPFLITLAVLLLLFAVGLGGAGAYAYLAIKDLPIRDAKTISDNLKVTSTIYDDAGEEIKNVYSGDDYRLLVEYEDLPQNLINAMVAIEDKTFWEHHGFNFQRMAGAVKESLTGGGDISGTSTITQQLARNAWLSDSRYERTITRKIREAWYAFQLEQELTKEEILTAYLNTISLGNHSYGVGAAAKSYFNKSVSELDLLECAALAALPQSPSYYSLITTVGVGEAQLTDPNLLLTTNQNMFLYNSAAEERIQLVLDNMLEQGYITEAEHAAASADNIKDHLHPQPLQTAGNAAFFVDYLIDDVARDLYETYPKIYTSYDDALQSVYSSGFQIYSTFNRQMQNIAMEEFENPKNFPSAYLKKDSAGNALDENAKITLYAYDNMFEEVSGDPYFRLMADEYEVLSNGGIRILAGNRLGIYNVTNPDGTTDIAVEFRDFYSYKENEMYITKGGVLTIPTEYKSMDGDGNLILSADYFASENCVFVMETDEKTGAEEYVIAPENFTLRQAVVQPQGAMVIIEQHTGRLKAMVGGRNIEGEMQYNRATATRQPGSTMKPLGTYGAALQMAAEGEKVTGNIKTFGDYWTPLSIIVDTQMEYRGKKWPDNWYNSFKGAQTMRQAIEQSENVPAVKVQLSVGNKRSVEFLKKLGITSVVESGEANDLNPAALALGGMTNGISPLENASAYSTFANEGEHIDPITYTEVLDKEGNVILDGTPKTTQAMDPAAAYIMNDMLRTAVASGIARTAQVKGVTVAGKTGTSSENYDAWFVGNTPDFSASVWIGLDNQIKMSQNSSAAAGMFARVMSRIYEELEIEPGEFPEQPKNVVKATVSGKTDIFIEGTVPSKLVYGGREFTCCLDSGMLATPWCTKTVTQYYGLEPTEAEGAADTENYIPSIDIAPRWYCPIHNQDHGTYPTGEGEAGPGYVPNDFSYEANENDNV